MKNKLSFILYISIIHHIKYNWCLW